MNKKEKFLRFLANETIEGYLPFQPILMHFAARLNGKTYGDFASDHKVLVESNIRALDRIKGAELYQKLLNGTVPVFGWAEGPLA